MSHTMYRFISFENFINLITTKKERYVRPCTWEDEYEGYLFATIDDEVKRKELIKYLFTILSPQEYCNTINNYIKIWQTKWHTYGQSWTTLKESDALWRSYSYNKQSVRIQSTEEKIQLMIQQKFDLEAYPINISPVKYDVMHSNILEQQVLQIKETSNIFEPYFHKRRAFIHEHEKRVIISDNSTWEWNAYSGYFTCHNFSRLYQGQQFSLDETIEKIDIEIQHMLVDIKRQNILDAMYIEDIKLNEYLTSVLINPFADDWIVDLISKVCEQNGIKCLGKSKLYKR